MRGGLLHQASGLTLLASCWLFATSSAGLAACRWTTPNFDVNTVNVRWTLTTSNKQTCDNVFRYWGKMKVDNLTVAVRARHGAAGIKNSISEPRFAYQPNPGFVGEDSFQLVLDAYNGYVDAKHKVTVDVDVVVTP